ncbi:MAG: hypothetical protein COC22_05980 [Flavobacteriaceae bacterium]|nr:MAG: hypothetical protein COC22_05980 [Flavobacteriaceae bacterium]
MKAQETTIKNVNSAEFQKLIKKKDDILLDVRTTYEYESGHIKDAVQLNYYSFSFKENLLLLPKDKPIYVYCRSGYRSKKTTKILIDNDYKNIYNLENGVLEWEKNNYPIKKEASN